MPSDKVRVFVAAIQAGADERAMYHQNIKSAGGHDDQQQALSGQKQQTGGCNPVR